MSFRQRTETGLFNAFMIHICLYDHHDVKDEFVLRIMIILGNVEHALTENRREKIKKKKAVGHFSLILPLTNFSNTKNEANNYLVYALAQIIPQKSLISKCSADMFLLFSFNPAVYDISRSAFISILTYIWEHAENW